MYKNNAYNERNWGVFNGCVTYISFEIGKNKINFRGNERAE